MADEEKKDEGIKEAAEKGIVAFVDKAYTDAFQGTMKRVGDVLEALAGRVSSKFSGMRLQNTIDDTREDIVVKEILAEILQERGVPNERIIEPSPKIAVPALRGMVLEDSTEVQKMYARVLATAMDKDTANRAHPGFITLLNQITRDEALIIGVLGKQFLHPVVRMIAVYPSSGHREVISRNFSLVGVHAGCSYPKMTQVYVGNLNRLGVTAVEECNCDLEHGDYEALKTHPMLLEEQAEHNKNLSDELKRDQKIEFIKYHIRLTTYGRQLAEACLTKSS
jgi:hypothetical protein